MTLVIMCYKCVAVSCGYDTQFAVRLVMGYTISFLLGHFWDTFRMYTRRLDMKGANIDWHDHVITLAGTTGTITSLTANHVSYPQLTATVSYYKFRKDRRSHLCLFWIYSLKKGC